MPETPSKEPPAWSVTCLCAAWCGVCREWQSEFLQLARSRPDLHCAWIDVEDEDDAMGDVEIETFPTVLVAHRDVVRFFGPIPPSAGGLQRLVAGLQQSIPQPFADPRGEATSLFARLQPLVFTRAGV